MDTKSFFLFSLLVLILNLDFGIEAVSLRRKRSLIQLANVLMYETRKNPLTFSNYGCYCGWGGQGTPVDKLDGCCMAHDFCYNEILKKNCLSAKYEEYSYEEIVKTGLRKIKCAGVPELAAVSKQTRDNLTCKQYSCYCDKRLGECLLRNIKDFNVDHYRMDQSICKTGSKNK
ncbi:hypothetical protein KUTeg_002059 [Tegillarca granosa]|uniref:Phospholipase A2 n=1 Tax=Tegillarca granosa TaxID=220873 RepID=A0ABQ9FWV3_TEGGR|nr:hypothetical protein KUTeg_002059 [Tegillarca granosa]